MVKRFNFKNINAHIRKRASLMKELGRAEPFLRGSIVRIARVCGNRNCKCARGEKHVSEYLTYRHRLKKKTVTIYIPIGILKEVKKWVKEYGRLKKIEEDICQIQRLIIKQYVKERKRQKR